MEIEVKKVEDIVEANMMQYSAYILLDRALPDIRDGLKPVHRRILYMMHLMKAYNLTKSANVTGQVMRIHPHGSCYGSVVGMVQQDNQLVPLLEGKGNYGQYTSSGLQPAADRYTEVKLAPIAIDLMKNFEKGTVPFIDNYDGTIKMPEVFDTKYPSILAYAQSGIGVGFSSSIPSFNIPELCDATAHYVRTGEHTMLIPDFATGGSIIYDEAIFKRINETGSGSVRIRGKATIDGNEIHITEIPYSTTRESIIEKIVELARKPTLKEVSDVQDLTGKKGMLITVTAKRGTDMNALLNKLYQFTPLQAAYSCNMNMLVNYYPKVLGVYKTIEEWVKWRRECARKELEYDIDKATKDLHIMRGLEKVLVDIDKAIEIIRHSKPEEIIPNLNNHFDIDDQQSEAVLNIRFLNLNEAHIQNKIKDINKLDIELNELKETLNNEEKFEQYIIDGLDSVKAKFGKPRKSEIIHVENTRQIRIVEEIPNYPVTIYLTKEGYCYKFRGGQQPNLKPGDEILKIFETDNLAKILIFSSKRLCYKVDISRIDETRATSLGTYLPSFFNAIDLEIVTYSVLDPKYKFALAIYKNNRINKIDLTTFNGRNKILKNAFNSKQDLLDLITLEEETTLKYITTRTEIEINTCDYDLTKSSGGTGKYATRKGEVQRVFVGL